MTLPPPGSDSSAVAQYVEGLVRECANDPRRAAWLDRAQRDLDLYLGDHFASAPTTEVERVVLNRIQNVVISMMAIQTSDPPKILFVPRETGEPPLYYANPAAPELGYAPADQPITADMARELRAMVERERSMRAAATGIAPKTLDDAVVEVTDRTAADALQVVFDAKWEEANGQAIFGENVLNKNILGWQPTLFEVEPDGKFCLTNVHPIHVFYDPLCSDSRLARYAIYDWLASTEQLIDRYPGHKDAIEAAGRRSIGLPGQGAYTPSAVYDQQFGREMAWVRSAWLRGQDYPMAEEEAISTGAVRVEHVPTGELVQEMDEQGQVIAESPKLAAIVVNRDGQEVSPTGPGWPRKPGIRYVVCIGNECIEDRQWPIDDIPLVNNVNTPIPYSCYGQGEPTRLDGLQMALNRALSAAITHHRFNAFPTEVIPQSVAELMPEAIRNAHTRPATRIKVPDDLIQRFGGIKNIIGNIDVPPIPADAWKLIQFLVDAIDKEGHQAEVLQGNAAPGWSGDAINSLQNAATQVIKAKSLKTEQWLRGLAGVMSEWIIRHMSDREWRRHCSKFPPVVLAAFRDRLKSMTMDISVKIGSGSAANSRQETNNLIAARGAGLPISEPTLMEQLGLDPPAELQKSAQWQEQVARTLPTPPQQPGLPPGPPVAANNPATTA